MTRCDAQPRPGAPTGRTGRLARLTETGAKCTRTMAQPLQSPFGHCGCSTQCPAPKTSPAWRLALCLVFRPRTRPVNLYSGELKYVQLCSTGLNGAATNWPPWVRSTKGHFCHRNQCVSTSRRRSLGISLWIGPKKTADCFHAASLARKQGGMGNHRRVTNSCRHDTGHYDGGTLHRCWWEPLRPLRFAIGVLKKLASWYTWQ